MSDGAPTPTPEPPGKKTPAYREVTLAAIVFGVIVGAVMNAAITYAGLKIGFTIVGSAIAAVLGFGVLRGILRKGTILETNIAQTVASAVNTPNSGVIFTVPVLLLLGYNLSFGELNFWLITLACVAGAILGGAFIVPLRKQMLDIERLRFPSATAVAAILKSPGAGPKKSIVLVIGIVLSALIAAPAQLHNLRSAAEIDDLDTLVEEGRISRADLLLTTQIQNWIDTQEAPAELVEHGRLSFELVDAKAANTPDAKRDLTPEVKTQRATRVRELELLIADANERAKRVIAQREDIASDKQRLLDAGYPLELAKRAYLASGNEVQGQSATWEDLRDVKAGWAAQPMLGYADLQMRMDRETLEDAEPVDYAYNGLGSEDPVLTQRVDRDRDGNADLVIEDESVDVGRLLGLPDQIQLIFAIAPFALGAGYLTGRAGLLVLAGGILAYVVINPALYAMGWLPETVDAASAPGFAYGGINRPLGIGLLLGGALMGVVASLPAIKEAFKSIAASKSAGPSVGGSGKRDELGLRVLIVAALAAIVLLFIAADFTGGRAINTVDPLTGEKIEAVDEFVAEHNGYVIAFASADSLAAFEGADAERKDLEVASLAADKPGLLAGLDPHLRALLIAIVGALWIWFAGIIIAQCTGMTDWSPISGMALLTVVLVMLLGGPGGVVGAVLIGARSASRSRAPRT
ncbi:MAG: OPT/YSL family transporter [Planctomycetota bacterium]